MRHVRWLLVGFAAGAAVAYLAGVLRGRGRPVPMTSDDEGGDD